MPTLLNDLEIQPEKCHFESPMALLTVKPVSGFERLIVQRKESISAVTRESLQAERMNLTVFHGYHEVVQLCRKILGAAQFTVVQVGENNLLCLQKPNHLRPSISFLLKFVPAVEGGTSISFSDCGKSSPSFSAKVCWLRREIQRKIHAA